ncbi:MAG: filamentous hemagglutinin N-terminal domain-containing protein [Succinivibrio sp.]|nr:filamentous hemagglutinin N-terminal domain-containing protein [Succinivibrio sp.]
MTNKLFKITAVTTAIFGASCAHASSVLPTGGQVLHGSAQIFESNSNSMYIASITDKNVISWENFNVGKNASVTFDNKAYLNLVRGAKASVIEGSIYTNTGGRFYLVNPNGITLANNASIIADKVVLSTSKITPDRVNDFLATGDLKVAKKGMGKIKLLGSISTANLMVDGSQVIIKDIANIKNAYTSTGGAPLINTDTSSIEIASSTKRIDIGGNKGVDFKKDYNLTVDDGLVDQTGKIAITSKDEFLAIKNNMAGDYFICDDIKLDTITESIGGQNAFTGSIDGAFNKLTFNLDTTSSNGFNVGLFSKLDKALIENLKITDAKVSVKDPNDRSNVGVLAGSIKDSVLKNVQVDNATFGFDKLNNKLINVGAIAGLVEGNQTSLSNVTSGVSSNTAQEFFTNKANLNYGAMFGEVTALLQQKGLVAVNIAKDATNDVSHLKAIGKNPLKQELFDANDLKNHPDYFEINNRIEHKGFYCPFFVDSDKTFIYDKDVSYNYNEFINNEYFKAQNYVDISFDYTGNMSEINDYHHHYENKTLGQQFYFVQGDKIASDLVHTIKIEAEKVELPPVVIKDAPKALDNKISLNDTEAMFAFDRKKVNTILSFTNVQVEESDLMPPKLLASLSLDDSDENSLVAQNQAQDTETEDKFS